MPMNDWNRVGSIAVFAAALVACSGGTTPSDDAAVIDAMADAIPSDARPSDANARSCPLPNYPDETCTGVPSGTSLRRVPADVTSGPGWMWNGDGAIQVTVDGTVIDGLEVAGCISVEATGVTVRNTRAQCITTGSSPRARDPMSPRLTIEDCEVVCPDMDGTTAIGDRNINVYRVNIHGCENGFDMDSDAEIHDSYIHDLHQSVIAHTDGLQSAVGTNLVIDHNRFYAETPGACGDPSGHTADCGGTSAININNTAAGPMSANTTVSHNLVAGGAYTLYCPVPQTLNFRVVDNQWSTIFYPNGGAYGTSSDCRATMAGVSEWSGNVWKETGAAIDAQ